MPQLSQYSSQFNENLILKLFHSCSTTFLVFSDLFYLNNMLKLRCKVKKKRLLQKNIYISVNIQYSLMKIDIWIVPYLLISFQILIRLIKVLNLRYKVKNKRARNSNSCENTWHLNKDFIAVEYKICYQFWRKIEKKEWDTLLIYHDWWNNK